MTMIVGFSTSNRRIAVKTTFNFLCIFALLVVLSEGGWSWNIIPSTAPIDVNRYTVVIVEETEKRQSLPPEQLNAINSQVWRDYVARQNGRWRVLDPHTDVSKDKKWVQDSLSLHRDSLPWLIFADPNRGCSVPLPNNIDELMEAIKK